MATYTGHEFVEECSWLAADKEVEQYIYIALNITMNREFKKKNLHVNMYTYMCTYTYMRMHIYSDL